MIIVLKFMSWCWIALGVYRCNGRSLFNLEQLCVFLSGLSYPPSRASLFELRNVGGCRPSWVAQSQPLSSECSLSKIESFPSSLRIVVVPLLTSTKEKRWSNSALLGFEPTTFLIHDLSNWRFRPLDHRGRLTTHLLYLLKTHCFYSIKYWRSWWHSFKFLGWLE